MAQRGKLFNSDNQLSSNFATQVFQDSNGFIWIAMGIGVLYGKREHLEKMPPFLTGGEMIESVRRDGALFAQPPHKFEAGTVNAGGAAGLTAAIDYLENIGFEQIGRASCRERV